MDLIRSWPPPLFTRAHTHTSLPHIARKTYFSVTDYDPLMCHKPSKLLVCYFKSTFVCQRHVFTSVWVDRPPLCHISPRGPGSCHFCGCCYKAGRFHELHSHELPLCSLEWNGKLYETSYDFMHLFTANQIYSVEICSTVTLSCM